MGWVEWTLIGIGVVAIGILKLKVFNKIQAKKAEKKAQADRYKEEE
jgi:hypothetical protein